MALAWITYPVGSTKLDLNCCSRHDMTCCSIVNSASCRGRPPKNSTCEEALLAGTSFGRVLWSSARGTSTDQHQLTQADRRRQPTTVLFPRLDLLVRAVKLSVHVDSPHAKADARVHGRRTRAQVKPTVQGSRPWPGSNRDHASSGARRIAAIRGSQHWA